MCLCAGYFKCPAGASRNAALKEQLLEKAADYKTEEAGLKQMVHLLKEYEAAPVADEQMRELFTMGFHDKNL